MSKYFSLCSLLLTLIIASNLSKANDTTSTSDSQKPSLQYYEPDGLYPHGRLEVGALGQMTKYFGEYTDNRVGIAGGLFTRYFMPFLPEFGLGASFSHGMLYYERRYKERFGDDFARQFPPENFPDARQESVLRYTKVTSFSLLGFLNLFPRKHLNYYIMAGYSILSFQAQDIVDNPLDGLGRKRDYPDFEVKHEFDYHLYGGLGIDYLITRKFSVGFQTTYHKLETDILDGYGQLAPGGVATAVDAFAEFSIKLSIYLFQDNDIDNDGISNENEEALGTNPYDDDTDSDGITDYTEIEILKSNPLSYDTDRDGLPDGRELELNTDLSSADSDNDGLDDLHEVEISKSNPGSADSDFDGLTDYDEYRLGTNPNDGDSDDDGIMDFDDKCPNKYGYPELMGCPPKERGVTFIRDTVVKYDTVIVYQAPDIRVEKDTIEVIREIIRVEQGSSYRPNGINFKTGSAAIKVESELILDLVVEWLNKNPDISIRINGHTDSQGGFDYNMKLSKNRAIAVKKYLVSQGISSARLFTEGFGYSKRIDFTGTPKGEARNRRIEFIISNQED